MTEYEKQIGTERYENHILVDALEFYIARLEDISGMNPDAVLRCKQLLEKLESKY